MEPLVSLATHLILVPDTYAPTNLYTVSTGSLYLGDYGRCLQAKNLLWLPHLTVQVSGQCTQEHGVAFRDVLWRAKSWTWWSWYFLGHHHRRQAGGSPWKGQGCGGHTGGSKNRHLEFSLEWKSIWCRLQRKVVEPSSLDVYKEQLDMTFSALFWLTRWGLIKSWDSMLGGFFQSK